MIARTIGTIRMVVSASRENLERHGTPTHPSDLAQHDCIAWSSLGPLNSWWFREANADCTFPIRTRFSTSSADSALDAAMSGLGLVQTTSYQAERGVRDGGLTILLKDFECAPTPVSLVHAGNRSVPLKLRAFLDFAVPRLSERLKQIERAIA
jgi:DNA-binding transcriptional LysR family regulator